jgi:murein DD-endopeptidase MepM/ murein hydrolase activator NlpD
MLDYKTSRHASRPRRRKRLLILFLAVLGGGALLVNHSATVTDTEAHTQASFFAPEPSLAPPPEPEIRREIIEGTIHPGETLSNLLGEYCSPAELHELSVRSRPVFPLSSICAGQPYRLIVNDGALERFEYDINRNDQFIIHRGEEKLEVSRIPIEYETRVELIRGHITSSLYDAVASSGERSELAVRLADIFAYDVDFLRDVRSGDSFQVVIEKRQRDGVQAGYGQLLAAEFNNQGRTFQAFRFQADKNSSAYYDAAGRSLRKAFLKAPLSFTRISSGFSMKRFHPITKSWKAHPAIDYAAPTGTPVMAIGNATIKEIGRTSNNGNYIKLSHTNGYESMYLHLNGFAKGMQRGKRVEQGQVIGYVGSTGLATGPHLCFRMTQNGKPINPTTIKSVPSAPLGNEALGRFKAQISPLLAMFEGREVEVAELADESSAAGENQL